MTKKFPTTAVGYPISGAVAHHAAAAADFVLDASAAALKVITNHDDAAFALLRVLRAGTVQDAINAFQEEWRNWIAEGYIKPDYYKTNQARHTLVELLDAYSHQNLDECQMDLLRKIYLVMASETVSSRDDPRPTQFMTLAKRLSSGEILVLFATHQVVIENIDNIRKSGTQFWNPRKWLELTTDRTGLVYPEVIEMHEVTLAEKRLLVARSHSDGSGFRSIKFGNVTEFGKGFCEFVCQYDVLKAKWKGRASNPEAHRDD